MPKFPLIGGPFSGRNKRLLTVVDELQFWLKTDGAIYDDIGDVARVVSYLPQGSGGDTTYQYAGTAEDEPALRRVRDILADDPRGCMTRELYRQPNYAVYSLQPTDAHPQTHLRHEHRSAEVDLLIAPLVMEVWKRGWETTGSCQERPAGERNAGWAYLDFPIPGHGREFAEAMRTAGIANRSAVTEVSIAGKRPAGGSFCFVLGKLLVYLPAADIERAAAWLRG